MMNINVDHLSLKDRITAHNIYCEHKYLPNEVIYSMAEFNDVMDYFEYTFLDVCFMTSTLFNPHDNWFGFDNGFLVSFSSEYAVLTYCGETFEELMEDIDDDPEDYLARLEVTKA